MTTSKELDDMLDTLVPVVTPLVKAIEAMPATTKDHYGDYMAAIDRLVKMAGGNKGTAIGIGVALQRAGANRAGVIAALRSLGHI